MKRYWLLLILLLFFVSVGFAQAGNQLPMYGKAQKTKEQLKADRIFIRQVEKEFGSRAEASAYHAKRGWDYLYNDDPYTAMKRFNQAWLLDNSNALAHWGFTTITAMHIGLENSLQHFYKAISLDSTNYSLMNDAAYAHMLLYEEAGTIANLEKAISLSRRSVPFKPDGARAFSLLTQFYSYYPQKDSAIKYMNLTYAMDSVLVTPELRNKILKK